MIDFSNIDDILDFAISNEQQAVDFYRELAIKANNNTIRHTFETFALEEVGHKEKLIRIKEEKSFSISKETVLDLKLADYIDNVKPSTAMTYQDALIIAMKREKSAFKLYTNLASKTNNMILQSLFSQLAIEESKHKLMFELEYDEVILKEN
jgi:rubrerythrin